MREGCAGVSPNFGSKSSSPDCKSKKAESFGFMSGTQEILQNLLRRKVTPKKMSGVSIDAQSKSANKNGLYV